VTALDTLAHLWRSAGRVVVLTGAILTASETPYDHAADVKIADPLEAVLPAVRDRVLSGGDA
jgi:hypothetical protein